MIVVDASVLYVALVSDLEDGNRVRARLADERLAAPALLDLEVASALRRDVRRGSVAGPRAEQALTDLATIALQRALHVPLIARIWQLRENVSSYDAAYVALAERLSTTLLTADAHLAGAPGVRCPIELWA